jgi:hypothetical protein
MLTSELQQKPVELSSQLLRVLESQQRVRFHDIVTGDESWFLSSTTIIGKYGAHQPIGSYKIFAQSLPVPDLWN